MNKGLKICISIVAAFVALFLWSYILVLVEWDSVFLKYLGAAFAFGAGKVVYAFLGKKGKQNDNEPKNEK